MSLESQLFEKTNNYTHMVILLDRSGSMSSILEATISGFNKVIEEQRKLEGKATISLYQFDDQFDTIYEMKDLADSTELNTSNFVPRGMTGLLDGIGKTIALTKESLEKLPEEDRPGKIIVTIMTDGGENASKEYDGETIKTMIKSLEDDKGWVFVYLGANQDAVTTATSMGIKGTSALTYGATSRGMTNATYSMNKMYSRVRSADITTDDLSSFASFDAEDHDLQDLD